MTLFCFFGGAETVQKGPLQKRVQKRALHCIILLMNFIFSIYWALIAIASSHFLYDQEGRCVNFPKLCLQNWQEMDMDLFEGSTGLWSPKDSGFIVEKTRWSSFWNIFDVKIIFGLACIQIFVNALYGIVKMVRHCKGGKERREKGSLKETLKQEEVDFNPLDIIVGVFACLTGKILKVSFSINSYI